MLLVPSLFVVSACRWRWWLAVGVVRVCLLLLVLLMFFVVVDDGGGFVAVVCFVVCDCLWL